MIVAGGCATTLVTMTPEAATTPTLPPLEPITSLEQYEEVAAFVVAAAEAYYQTETVLCDDATYDQLLRNLAEAEAAHPEWKTGAGVADQVAAGAAIGGEYRHARPMLSLDNIFNAEELANFIAKVGAAGGEGVRFSVEPKMDGVAISAHYENGQLTRLVTRGDGRTGEVVSHIIGRDKVVGLPTRLNEPISLEVRGEMIMTNEDFEEANRIREAAGEAAFSNPRNAVAGSVRAQDRRYGIPLTFVGYDAVHTTEGATTWETHSEAMVALGEAGVQTAATLTLPDGEPALTAVGAGEVSQAVARIEELRGEMGFLVDGAVIKADAVRVRRQMGEGSRAPRWAMAYKYPAEMALTKLLDIKTQVGRTGRVTPVAVLEEVTVGGVQVSSATLNNFEDIVRKDVRIGDTVWVRRAGEVIPEVVGPELSQRPEGTTPYQADPHCPRCGSELDQSEVNWRCTTPGCALPEAILYFASRDAMDIDGLGEHAVDVLIDAGLVKTTADLYRLTPAQVAGLDRYGRTSAQNLVSAIQASKDRGLERVLVSLGIRHLGRRLSTRLAQAYPTMALIEEAVARGPEAFAEIEGFGKVKSAIIVDGLRANAELISDLAAVGVDMAAKEAAPVRGEGALNGLKVLVTGAVPGHTRDTAKAAVEAAGGEAVGSVSGRTDVVLAGEGAGGSKLVKAESLGIPVIDVSADGEFDRICNEGVNIPAAS